MIKLRVRARKLRVLLLSIAASLQQGAHLVAAWEAEACEVTHPEFRRALQPLLGVLAANRVPLTYLLKVRPIQYGRLRALKGPCVCVCVCVCVAGAHDLD